MDKDKVEANIGDLKSVSMMLTGAENIERAVSDGFRVIEIRVGTSNSDKTNILVFSDTGRDDWDDFHTTVTELANRKAASLRHKAKREFTRIAESMQVEDVIEPIGESG